MSNTMPPNKKRNNYENAAADNAQSKPVSTPLTDEKEIIKLPLRSVKAGDREYLGYYDEKNLMIYLTDENGKLTGQTGKLKKPLAEFSESETNSSNDEEQKPENDDDGNAEDNTEAANDNEEPEEETNDDDKEESNNDDEDNDQDKKKSNSKKEKKNKPKEKVSSLPTVSNKPKKNDKEKKNKNVGAMIVIILIILAVGVIGIGGYLLYREKGISLFKTADVPQATANTSEIAASPEAAANVSETSAASKEDQITIIKAKNDIIPGEIITENNIQPISIDNKTYNQMAVNGNDFYKWDQNENVINMYASEYISAGKYISTNTITKTYNGDVSPWENHNSALKYADIPVPENEFKFDELKIGDKIDLHFEASKKEENTNETMTTAQTGVGIVTENKVVTSTSYDVYGLTIVDMITKENRKLFDVYSSLMKIPEANQESYLKNEIGKENNNYIESITPNRVRVALDNAYADILETSKTNKLQITISKTDKVDTATGEKKDFCNKETILFENINKVLKSTNGGK